MDSEFEQRVRQQPMKPIPSGWRAEILSAARAVQSTPPAVRLAHDFWLSTISSRLSTLLWPHPKAWAALATVWLFIFVLNFSMRDSAPVVAGKISVPSPEVIVELKKQQRMFAELVGTYEAPDVDRRKIFSPKPRSERTEILVG